MRSIVLGVVALCACAPQGFTGDSSKIFFTTPLSRDFESFEPKVRPVALGSHVSFTSYDLVPTQLLTPVSPQAMPVLLGPSPWLAPIRMSS